MFGACCKFRALLCAARLLVALSLCCNCRRHTSLVPLFDLANATVRHGYPLEPLRQAARTSPRFLSCPSLALVFPSLCALTVACLPQSLVMRLTRQRWHDKTFSIALNVRPLALFTPPSLPHSLSPSPAGLKGRNIFDTLAPELELKL